MLQTRFKGSFVNQKGHIWTAEIRQQSPTPYTTIAPLTFDADQPVTIEWAETEKYEPIIGATATLNVISPADRTFIDLYQVQPGQVMLYLSLDNQPWWQGTLDCETYEEPYQAASGYTVTLTFTDFGCLDRLKFQGQGLLSLNTYIINALTAANLPKPTYQLSLKYTDQTLKKADGTYNTRSAYQLENICINAANFYDEDGTPSTICDTLTALLQPLALRIVQRAGQVVVYDLNALYNTTDTDQIEPVTWDADEQTLTTDRLYQDAKIKLSTYAVTDLIPSDTATIDTKRLTAEATIYNTLDEKDTYAYESFKIKHLPTPTTTAIQDGAAKGITYLNPQASPFTIQPIHSAQQSSGIAWLALTNRTARANIALNIQPKPAYVKGDWDEPCDHGTIPPQGIANNTGLHGTRGQYIFTMPYTFCPCAAEAETDNTQYRWLKSTTDNYLKLEMELMIDARYNPFEQADTDNNEKKPQEWCTIREGVVYLPYRLTLHATQDGEPLYVYTNKDRYSGREWIKCTTTNNTDCLAYMAFYDNTDTSACEQKSGVQGFNTNHDPYAIRQYGANKKTGGNLDNYPKNLQADGELIPLPPATGYLQLSIGTGFIVYDDTDMGASSFAPSAPLIDPTIKSEASATDPDYERKKSVAWYSYYLNYAQRWILYKFPTLSIVKGAQAADAKADDIELQAWVNTQAKDTLSIDTQCGTTGTDFSTNQLATYRNTQGRQIHLFRTNPQATPPLTNPQQLRIEYDLLGLIFSQYATRHTTLEGEAITPTAPLSLFTERAQPATARFITKAETLNAITGTSTLKVVQLTPEAWSANIIK